MTRREFLLAGISAFACAVFAGAARAAAPLIDLAALYEKPDLPGIDYAPALRGEAGKRVRVTGFIAKHSSPEAELFIVTTLPGFRCPHCVGGDLPADSVVAYFEGGLPRAALDGKVTIEGVLDLGARTDPKSGFVSAIRLRNAAIVA